MSELQRGLARARNRALRPSLWVTLIAAFLCSPPAHGPALFAPVVHAQEPAEPEVRRDRSYLIQMGLTLEGVRRLTLWVEMHPNDPELARYAYPLSERYVEMAGHMTPSKKLATAHPHLLLIVENVERALDAAGRNDMAVFRQRMRTVREELVILDNVLKQLKFKIPELLR